MKAVVFGGGEISGHGGWRALQERIAGLESRLTLDLMGFAEPLSAFSDDQQRALSEARQSRLQDTMPSFQHATWGSCRHADSGEVSVPAF